jgi:hypothetical protein
MNIAARFICSAGLQPGIFLFFGIHRPAAPTTSTWPRPEYRRKPAFCSAGVPAGSFPVATTITDRFVFWLRVRPPTSRRLRHVSPRRGIRRGGLRPLQQRQRTIGLMRIHNLEKGTQEFTGVRTSTLTSLRCLRRSWLEQKKRQNRKPEKNADADAQTQVARSRRLQHRQPQHDQQRAKRRNEPQNPSLAIHVITLTQPMRPRCLS